MGDILAERQNFVEDLEIQEAFRRSVHHPRAVAKTKEVLQSAGLGQLFSFDLDRDTTRSTIGIQFKAVSQDVDAHRQAITDYVSQLPKFMQTMLGEFDTAFWVAKRPSGIDEATSKMRVNGGSGKTFEEIGLGKPFNKERALGIFTHHCDDSQKCKTTSEKIAGHEMGHLVDKVLKYPSNSDGFRNAYMKDLAGTVEAMRLFKKHGLNPARIETYTDDDLSSAGFNPDSLAQIKMHIKKNNSLPNYFKTSELGGTQETTTNATLEVFAELFLEEMDRRTVNGAVSPPNSLSKTMPECAKFVQSVVSDLERYYAFAPQPVISTTLQKGLRQSH